MWEWERVRQMPYQIDAWLPDDSPVLLVRVRLVNHHDHVTPVYWWSNIAVPETPETRVLSPANASYQLGEDTMNLRSYPVLVGVDVSYCLNRHRSGDRFFRIPPGQYPWIANVDKRGEGLFHASTTRLIGRKLWVFGRGRGGRQWQDYLNTPGHPYIEIQGGLTHTQAECLPMPPGDEWEWLEAYGAMDIDPEVAHGDDWQAVIRAARECVEADITQEQIERRLAESKAMALRPPAEIIHQGGGWGALELRRRRAAGEEPFGLGSLTFDDDSLTDEQAPWLALLETGALPDAAATDRPVSWMTQDEWREMLIESIDAGRSDHWLGWLHLGIMHFAAGRHDEAAEAWRTSLERKPSAWAYRNLAALAALREDHAEAARLYPRAVELAPAEPRLLLECGKAMLAAGEPGRWLDVVASLDGDASISGHVRLLEASAALDVDDLERAARVLNGPITLTHVREGDTSAAELWFAYHEKRLAHEEGMPVDDDLRQRVRRECPPPAHLDFRLA